MTSSPSSMPIATCSPQLLAEAVEAGLGAGGEALASEVAGAEAQHPGGDLEATVDVADVAELPQRLQHAVGGGAGEPGGLGDVGRGARRVLLVEGLEDRERPLDRLHRLRHVGTPFCRVRLSLCDSLVHWMRQNTTGVRDVDRRTSTSARSALGTSTLVRRRRPSSEVGREPLGRTVCGRHVVLFRREDGSAVALDDRCPHRGYPLSAGALVGDEIQCGYHGLRFDGCGTCVWAPGQDRVPSRANVPARAADRTGALGVVVDGRPRRRRRRRGSRRWRGSTIRPGRPCTASSRWRRGPSLLIDNLLDLSHETFLHAGYIGTPEVAETPITTRTDGHVVHVSRHMSAVECPPFYANSTGLTTPIDRWQDIEYHAPGCYLLHVRVAPAGSRAAARTAPIVGAAHVEVMYAITPVDEHHTLDFWAVSRDFAIDDAEVDAYLARMNREVVLQDVEALSLIEQRLGDDWSPPEVSLKIDTGGLAARRVLADLVAAEVVIPAGRASGQSSNGMPAYCSLIAPWALSECWMYAQLGFLEALVDLGLVGEAVEQARHPPREPHRRPHPPQRHLGVAVEVVVVVVVAVLDDAAREVEHVARREVEPLGAGGRHDVGGVAGEEQVAVAHRLGDEAAQRCDRLLDRRAGDDLRSTPRRGSGRAARPRSARRSTGRRCRRAGTARSSG